MRVYPRRSRYWKLKVVKLPKASRLRMLLERTPIPRGMLRTKRRRAKQDLERELSHVSATLKQGDRVFFVWKGKPRKGRFMYFAQSEPSTVPTAPDACWVRSPAPKVKEYNGEKLYQVLRTEIELIGRATKKPDSPYGWN